MSESICVYKDVYICTAGCGQMCKGTNACLSTRQTGAYVHKGAALRPYVGTQGEHICLSAYIPISVSVCAATDMCMHTRVRTRVCTCLHPYRYLTV